MSEQADLGGVIDRLRANLTGAVIPISEDDLQGLVDKGFLNTVLAAEATLTGYASDLVPDYLGAWGEDGVPLPSYEAGAAHQPSTVERAAGYPSLAETAERVRQGEVSPVDLAEATLARIAERDPLLNAFQLVLADEARAMAQRAEAEIAVGNYRGPLHGIPIAVKDLFAMGGTVTTAGSKILADNRTDFDSAVVERLKVAGAVIVGKTKMSEFAYAGSSLNAHYGPTRNPWNPEHDTGGSSSGSGAAVADGLVFGALGSDTGGSIRMPSALCGIVGLKPTYGRNSLYGAVTLSWSLDHCGPMTRTVEDTAIMQAVLAGYDARDARTRRVPVPDYLAALGHGVRGLRIGVLRDDGSDQPLATDEVLAAWKAGLHALANAGAELIELDLPEINDLRPLNSCILAGEATAYHEPMLQTRYQDFGEFPRQRLISSYAYGPNVGVRGQQARGELRHKLNRVFEQVDLLSTPTMPYGAPPLATMTRNTWFTGPFNALGWPAITVPVGLGEGNLPLALQLIGRPWDEMTVLSAAAVVEADGPWPGGKP
jgi:aspartyl-tRNA(Asn)/glutamyl-tRNA(Gln) amidotransferase subunit A